MQMLTLQSYVELLHNIYNDGEGLYVSKFKPL